MFSKNFKIKICKTIILPVALYGCETWYFILMEECRLRAFENRILRWIFGLYRDENREWRRLHNEELHSLYQTAKMYILCHVFFQVSASHEVRQLILPWLLRSSSSPSTVQCPLINLLWPTTIFHSNEVSIPFQLLSSNSVQN